MSLKLAGSAADEWRRNWTVVLAAAAGFGMMNAPTYLVGLFMAPLEAEFGWKRAFVASGLMFNAVAAVIGAPIIGAVVDRIGPRRIAVVGVTLVCTALALMSLVNAHLWSWWALWTFIAVSMVMIMPMVWNSAISSLFTSSRGLALATALCGLTISTSGMPIVGSLLIRTYGWRTACLGLAGLFAVIVLPAVYLLFTSAADRHRSNPDVSENRKAIVLPGLPGPEALRSSRYIRLVVASCTMIAAATVMANLIPIMMSFGQPQVTAAGIAGMAGIGALLGRLSSGFLLDRINGNMVAGGFLTLPVIAILLLQFAPHSLPIACAAAVILGACVGAELDAVAYLITRHFGLRSFGFLLAVASAAQVLAMGTGPIVFNYVFDTTGSYRPALWGAIPLCLIGSALFLSLGSYADRDWTTEP